MQNLTNIKIIKSNEIPKRKHKNINEWKYYFLPKHFQIGLKIYNFIKSKVVKKDKRNLIIFYWDLVNYKAEDLLNFYDEESINYHHQIIIITKSNEKLDVPQYL